MAATTTQALKQMQLKWSTHQGTILTNFDNLFKSESFVDVILAAEGKQLKAHKMLLSSCSPYFEELFKQMECDKYPIVFLKDVKFTELQSLVNFMYQGEVKVSQEDLPSLLNVAKALRVRGLSSDQPVPPPPSNAKSIPLQDLIGSSNTTKTKPNTETMSKSKVVPNTPETTSNFTNNNNRDTPITIVNSKSLSQYVVQKPTTATQLPSGRPKLNQPAIKLTAANSAPASSMVRIPILQFENGSSTPRERYVIASPVNSTVSSQNLPRILGPKRQIRTVTTPNPAPFKIRPNILGNKGTGAGAVTTFAVLPVRKEPNDPPILFPEVHLPDVKPQFELVKTRPLSEILELEEEEVEMMNASENSEAGSPPDLSGSSWSYVDPEKLENMAFVVPPVELSASSMNRGSQNQKLLAARFRNSRRRQLLQRNKPIKMFMHQCKSCLKLYQRKGSLVRHEKYECNKPPQFQCDYCGINMRHTFHKTIHEKSCKKKYRKGIARQLAPTSSPSSFKVQLLENMTQN